MGDEKEIVTLVEDVEEELTTLEEDNEEEFVTVEEDIAGGTNNYNNLNNKPKINNVELVGNKTSKDLKIQDEMESLTNMEIEEILNSFV